MSNRIEVGDKVRVVWPGESLIDGVVLYTPVATGDCWIIETDSAIHYVQSFETIWKEKPNSVLSGGPKGPSDSNTQLCVTFGGRNESNKP